MNKGQERDIINAIRSGSNDSALELLYLTLQPRIVKFIILNNGSKDDARDIFQDALVILFHQIRAEKFNEDNDIGGFMYAVSRNLWINKVKKQSRTSLIKDTEEYTMASTSQDALQLIISDEKAQFINEVMEQIGDECKKLLKLSVFEKLSMKEISSKMGYSSEGVAKTYNYRCKQKLVALVKDNKLIQALFVE